jgi:hypothetical protein
LALSALAIAMLATPAFAQRQVSSHEISYSQAANSYPNGNVHSGSEQSFQSGNEFNGGY